MSNIRITVYTRQHLKELTATYRKLGYKITAFGKDLRELKRDNDFIFIRNLGKEV